MAKEEKAVKDLTDNALNKKLTKAQEDLEAARKAVGEAEDVYNELMAEKDRRYKEKLLDMIVKSGKSDDEIMEFFSK